MVHLLPKYRQKLKQEPSQVHTIKHWTPDRAETLRGCFEATDWNVFFDSCESDQDALTDTVTSYIILCEDSTIPTKEVRIYPNNKPWTGKDLKQCLNEKKIAYLQGNKQKVRELEKQFRTKAKTARLEYKSKIEEHFKSMNATDSWKGLNVMMGRNTQQQRVKYPDPVKFVNEINTFYARFDDKDFRNE